MAQSGRFQSGKNDDARDHINTCFFLLPLSIKALREITNLNQTEIRQRLRAKTFPFSRLNKKNRDVLGHLPPSWVRGAANRLIIEERTGITAD